MKRIEDNINQISLAKATYYKALLDWLDNPNDLTSSCLDKALGNWVELLEPAKKNNETREEGNASYIKATKITHKELLNKKVIRWRELERDIIIYDDEDQTLANQLYKVARKYQIGREEIKWII